MGSAALLSFLILTPAAALGEEGGMTAALLKEISNSRTEEIFPLLKPIPLPAGLSVHLLMLFLSAGIMLSLFSYTKRNACLRPRGLLVAVESLILFVQDDVVFPVMGEDRGKKWLPFFCTLFVFLLIVNLLGLITAFKTATGNINVTTALSLMILGLIFWEGFKNLGLKHFFINLYPTGTPWPVGFFVVFLEFSGLFIKTAVLSLRLFVNMFAGHLASSSFLVLIFVISPWVSAVSVSFSVFTYLLEILVGFIQAVVFTLLSCIFITLSSSGHE